MKGHSYIIKLATTSKALNSGLLQIAISVSEVALLQSKLAAFPTLPTPTESSRAKTSDLKYWSMFLQTYLVLDLGLS